MRRTLIAGAVVAGALAVPGTASAHLRTGRVAVDYSASIARPPPQVARAVAARVYPADLALGLAARPGHSVVVLGYSGEPFLRIGPDGAYANRGSLTATGLGLAEHGSGWQRTSLRARVVWHDARLHSLPAGVERGRWALPLVVDGSRSELSGELERPSRPPAWPWLAIGALFAATSAWLLAHRRPGTLRTATTALGVLAAIATTVVVSSFAATTTASQGRWVETGNELVFVLVGVAFVVWGSRDARALAGGMLGLLALAVGMTGLPVLLHGVVLSALPADLVRTAVVVSIAAGSAAAATGLVVFFDVLEHYEEPTATERYL